MNPSYKGVHHLIPSKLKSINKNKNKNARARNCWRLHQRLNCGDSKQIKLGRDTNYSKVFCPQGPPTMSWGKKVQTIDNSY